ncbi:hypothetical protein N7476_002776 [Penicillium atrosanguineum]|uniref:TLC domain-containing protein n=1 Tax=Penicillium atrosanguineum TaxID=1132637 RepID=A0A9W9Q3Z3_9EURO|nr:hypothetical protein N7526_005370 [Penicillium atrosanguineum]KAJ5324176.1 hypothetical protein N7476_002776 [Penicillium atrosanguineum]
MPAKTATARPAGARARGPGPQETKETKEIKETKEAREGHARGHARQSSDSARRRSRRSFLRGFKNQVAEHTWLVPLVLVLAILSLYAINPSESNVIHHFIFLSYKLSEGGKEGIPQYGKGLWDIAFVTFYTIVLSFTREFIMQELLRPLAKFAGIKSRGKQMRFMEQMYTAIYFGMTGPAGLYVMSRSPVWYFKTSAMYEGFPHRTHEAAFKFYYLFEAAYWAQQAIVMLLGQEKRRKDFKELVAHHIVTLSLIALSYRFHFTYIGIAIYITHDISDFFLAMSKSFHYIDSDLIIPFYALSVVSWIYLRHYLNLGILWSILTEFKTVGPYELNWETQQYKCWISQAITFALLASLQILNLFWLYFLMGSAWKFLAYGMKKDDRSEAEQSEIEEMMQKHQAKAKAKAS